MVLFDSAYPNLPERAMKTRADRTTSGTASYFNYEGEDGKVIKDIAW